MLQVMLASVTNLALPVTLIRMVIALLNKSSTTLSARNDKCRPLFFLTQWARHLLYLLHAAATNP